MSTVHDDALTYSPLARAARNTQSLIHQDHSAMPSTLAQDSTQNGRLSEDDTKTVLTRSLEDAACHSAELQEVVQAAADRLDDQHLHLAARSLQELNEDLNDLAYGEGVPSDE